MPTWTAPVAASKEELLDILHFSLFLLWLNALQPGVASQNVAHRLTVGTFGNDLNTFATLAFVLSNGPRYANKAQSRTVFVVVVVVVAVVSVVVVVNVVVVHASAAKKWSNPTEFTSPGGVMLPSNSPTLTSAVFEVMHSRSAILR